MAIKYRGHKIIQDIDHDRPCIIVIIFFVNIFSLFSCQALCSARVIGTTSSYTLRVLAGEQPQVATAAARAAPALDDEDDDDGTVHGPKSLSDIQMAPTARMYPKYHYLPQILIHYL